MVNIKHVMECNWLLMKPVNTRQQWYQSTCSDPWGKQLHRNVRVTLNKNHLQKETHFNNPKWPRHKKHISPEGKQLLRQKVEEVMSYNSSKSQPSSKQTGESSGLSRKERRARCYICRKRGHVYWKCINKERSTKIQEPNMTNPVMTEVQEKLNYPERVHVTTSY
ncbi:ARID DNA-binding domain-containing protein [Tanacetum coccineum]